MTYSIVGADINSREVGGAGTSCLGGEDVFVIYGAVPGHGVVHAQAYYDLRARQRATELLQSDLPPADILASITQPSFDRDSDIRQYGVVDALGRSAGFTGAATTPFAADRQGNANGFAYSVQGNILTSPRVLSQAAGAFEAGGCDLAERLMNALQAGAVGGEGDSRCTSQGIPSDSAFLQVESPSASLGGYLSLRVQSSGRDNPLPLLRALFDGWRAEHPCPSAPANPPTEPNESSASSAPGCSCYLAGAEPRAMPTPIPTSGVLLGSLLVVAWRRHRTARQLCPVQPA